MMTAQKSGFEFSPQKGINVFKISCTCSNLFYHFNINMLINQY